MEPPARHVRPQPGERVGLFGRQRPASRAAPLSAADRSAPPCAAAETNGSRSLRSSRTDTRPRRARRFRVSAPMPRSRSTRAGSPSRRAVQAPRAQQPASRRGSRATSSDSLRHPRAVAARGKLLPFHAERHDAHGAERRRLPCHRLRRGDQPIAQQPRITASRLPRTRTGSSAQLSRREAPAIRQRAKHHERAPRVAARSSQTSTTGVGDRDAPLALDPRERRHGRRDGLTRTGDVVLGRPQREIDDVSGQERRVVEHVDAPA